MLPEVATAQSSFHIGVTVYKEWFLFKIVLNLLGDIHY